MVQTIQETLAHGQGKDAGISDGHRIEYMDTVEAYNKWAEVYDTDGNFLQALDTIEMMNDLLPRFLGLVQEQSKTESSTTSDEQVLRLVDLGCGTGRNTLQLAKAAPKEAQIIGLDASPGMLEVAKETLQANGETDPVDGGRVVLGVYDLLSPQPESLPVSLRSGSRASGVISTLVLEHIPLGKFFRGAAQLITPGGYLLVTNMHEEMGNISQAGFVDVVSGKKIRPTSYAHAIGDVVVAAERAGFEVVELDDGERVRERRVDAEMVEKLGGRAKKWVNVMVWFGICFRIRSG
ncbi:hypothetical protein BDW74DRAFT_88949 [Aspergillus multicolor]|uniref:class I SAM-dependent methyltransferase n=1 Tax=Aspergillus multicolor TaxID=41759 RepID=UPI003CCCD071